MTPHCSGTSGEDKISGSLGFIVAERHIRYSRTSCQARSTAICAAFQSGIPPATRRDTAHIPTTSRDTRRSKGSPPTLACLTASDSHFTIILIRLSLYRHGILGIMSWALDVPDGPPPMLSTIPPPRPFPETWIFA